MAFTGTPVVTKIADNLFRITGVSLGIGAAGTIGLVEKTVAPEVPITTPGPWGPYQEPGHHGGLVTLDESVQCTCNEVDPAGTTVEPPAVAKTGTKPEDFLITITNRDAAATGALEIYVRYH